jgi:hypothetical protein
MKKLCKSLSVAEGNLVILISKHILIGLKLAKQNKNTVIKNNCIFTGNLTNDCDKIQLDQEDVRRWSDMTNLPGPRMNHALIVKNGILYAIGGIHINNPDGLYGTIDQAYNIKTNIWTSETKITRRKSPCLTFVNNRQDVVYVGGADTYAIV